MNSLYQQIGMMGSPIGGIKQMMNTIKSASDPNAAMQMLANKNPQMRQVMQMVQENGGDPKAAFYNLAKQKGVDPEQILSMLR